MKPETRRALIEELLLNEGELTEEDVKTIVRMRDLAMKFGMKIKLEFR